jgi:hypothetical protein
VIIACPNIARKAVKWRGIAWRGVGKGVGWIKAVTPLSHLHPFPTRTRSAEEALEEGERRSQLVEYMARWNELPSFTVVLIRMQDVHKREMIETQVSGSSTHEGGRAGGRGRARGHEVRH